jgi:hypothetical protein
VRQRSAGGAASAASGECALPNGYMPSWRGGTAAQFACAVVAECKRVGLGLPTQWAYILATVQLETGGTYKPVREGFYVAPGDFAAAEAWRKANLP